MPYFAIGPSVGKMHRNSCWAASLAWFLKAVRAGTRPRSSPPLYPYTDDNGAIRPQAMLGGWNSDIRLKMSKYG